MNLKKLLRLHPAPNNNLLNSITSQNNLFKNEAVKFSFFRAAGDEKKICDLFLKKVQKKFLFWLQKKVSSFERENSLTLNSTITCQCSPHIVHFFGVSHKLSREHEIRAFFYFVTTSLLPPNDDVEKFIYFLLWQRTRKRRRNLSMSGMSLGFCLKLTTFFFIIATNNVAGYFMSTMKIRLGRGELVAETWWENFMGEAERETLNIYKGNGWTLSFSNVKQCGKWNISKKVSTTSKNTIRRSKHHKIFL